MKLAFFNDFQLGTVDGDMVSDLSALSSSLPAGSPQETMSHLIGNWEEWMPRIEEAASSANQLPLLDVRLRPPLPAPTNVVCMAVNYMEDGALKTRPPKNAFLKNPRTVVGHADEVVLPDVPASIFELEAEIAVVINRHVDRIAAPDALRCVFGYINFLDGSARGMANDIGLPFHMKNHYTFAPLGPWITTRDEIEQPQALRVRQWNNGEITQDYPTSDMAYNIAESIEFISSVTPLGPGDVIALGTNHQGLHPIQDGDQVDVQVEGLGKLTVRVRDPLKRTWARETRRQRAQAGQPGAAPQLTGKYATTP